MPSDYSTVLLAGGDPDLLLLRSAVLAAAGIWSLGARNAEQAIQVLGLVPCEMPSFVTPWMKLTGSSSPGSWKAETRAPGCCISLPATIVPTRGFCGKSRRLWGYPLLCRTRSWNHRRRIREWYDRDCAETSTSHSFSTRNCGSVYGTRLWTILPGLKHHYCAAGHSC